MGDETFTAKLDCNIRRHICFTQSLSEIFTHFEFVIYTFRKSVCLNL